MSHLKIVARAAVVSMAVFNAGGQVVNVSQFREVRAWATGETDFRSTSAVGSWNESVTVRDYFPLVSGGTGVQVSEVSPSGFSAVGSVDAADDFMGYNGAARSWYAAEFDLEAAMAYSLRGSWRTDDDHWSHSPDGRIRFERLSPSPQVYHFSSYRYDPQTGNSVTYGSVDIGGGLPPGRYRIEAGSYMAVGAPSDRFEGHGQFEFELDVFVPTPAGLWLLALAGVMGRRRRAGHP